MTLPEATAAESTETLTLTVNKSYMIEFDVDIDDVIIANEKIANIVARDRRRVAVHGRRAGREQHRVPRSLGPARSRRWKSR